MDWFDIFILTYFCLNLAGYLYFIVYGICCPKEHWDALIFPMIMRSLDENKCSAYKKNIIMAILLFLFPIGLLAYYFMLLILATIVVLITKIDDLVQAIKRRKK